MPEAFRKVAVIVWLASRMLLFVCAPYYLYIAVNQNEELKENDQHLVSNCLLLYMLMYELLNTPLTCLSMDTTSCEAFLESFKNLRRPPSDPAANANAEPLMGANP
jgi:hypothetical protein